MKLIAEKAKLHEEGGAITANFIPADQMTDDQLREHLLVAHAFQDYEENAETEPYYLRTCDRTSLELVHADEHAEYIGGGAVTCQHVHGKVTI